MVDVLDRNLTPSKSIPFELLQMVTLLYIIYMVACREKWLRDSAP
jgi:hypothetical protein